MNTANVFQVKGHQFVNAELMKFAARNMDKISSNTNVFKDLGIDCSHISEKMLGTIKSRSYVDKDTPITLEQVFIRIGEYYTESLYLYTDDETGKHIVSGSEPWFSSENDDQLWITCEIYKPSSGHGCRWVEISTKEINKICGYWRDKNISGN